ncbi:RNA polymerase sigma factor [Paenibacillus glycinis]|uniref:Sigma-70 family RNA polymerase sigma factor n=1 Tax=Paenibacillus glycinis TaxID=2697035 RepID=A0ABW9XNU8_9BACL|nr:RNA polymerase sigma factor [Paenibacillus glycinis]NBD24301.1 sigma-70 family RNA polymerase sigma factor [Paenibacillus glycinis]
MLVKERCATDEAFDALYEQYHGLVYRIAYAFVKDDFLAQDIVQEVFIKIFAHLASVDGVNNKRAWVKAIARNKAIDYCRKQSRRLVLLTGQIERLAGPAEAAAEREGHPGADDAFAMLDKLEPKFRQPLLLLYVHGMSYNQIADAQNTTLGAVKTRIHRAKKKLRAMHPLDSDRA